MRREFVAVPSDGSWADVAAVQRVVAAACVRQGVRVPPLARAAPAEVQAAFEDAMKRVRGRVRARAAAAAVGAAVAGVVVGWLAARTRAPPRDRARDRASPRWRSEGGGRRGGLA